MRSLGNEIPSYAVSVVWEKQEPLLLNKWLNCKPGVVLLLSLPGWIRYILIPRGDWRFFADNLRMRAAVRGWIRLLLLRNWVFSPYADSPTWKRKPGTWWYVTSLSRLNKVATCVDIWIVLRRRRRLGTLWTVAAFGRVMRSQLVSGPSVQLADVTHAPSGDRQFSPVALQGRKRDAGVEWTTPEGETQFGGQRAPHT